MQKFLFLLLIFTNSFSVLAKEKVVLLAMPYYEGYTNPDGTGVYWDLFKDIYKKHGYTVKTQNFPYTRTIFFVQNKQADIVTGAYYKEFDKALFPKKKLNFDIDIVSAVFLKSFKNKKLRTSDLINKRVGWPRGYRYDLYLPKLKKPQHLTNSLYAINMIKMGRLDYFLDSNTEIDLALNKIDPKRKILRTQEILRLYLYPAFSDSKKGRTLLKIYETELPKIEKSGKLKKYFDKYGADFVNRNRQNH